MSIVISIWGPEKSAKSSLGFTFPKPIRHYDFDMGYDRAAWRFKDEVEDGLITTMACATPVDLRLNKNTPLQGFRELWTAFITDYLKTLADPNIATVMIDTATQAWQICHLGYLQEKQEAQLPIGPGQKLRERLQPIEYAEPNGRMRAVEQAGKAYGKNLVLTHYQTDTYATRLGPSGPEEYNTGEKQLDGFKHTANLSDIVLRTKIDGGTPKALVTVCGMSLNMVGLELVEPTYDKIMEALDKVRMIG